MAKRGVVAKLYLVQFSTQPHELPLYLKREYIHGREIDIDFPTTATIENAFLTREQKYAEILRDELAAKGYKAHLRYIEISYPRRLNE